MAYRLLKSPWKLYLKSYDDLENKVFITVIYVTG